MLAPQEDDPMKADSPEFGSLYQSAVHVKYIAYIIRVSCICYYIDTYIPSINALLTRFNPGTPY
jgi:hypothetical protein